MPEFHLDTSGAVIQGPRSAWDTVPIKWRWADLDAFTQGYIEALFFTSCDEPGRWYFDREDSAKGYVDPGFADLAPEALARILADCAKFQAAKGCQYLAFMDRKGKLEGADIPDDAQAGRDFWFTRNGHGCGFWDGDWPEPYAAQLTAAAEAFGAVDPYLGDDGKVHLS